MAADCQPSKIKCFQPATSCALSWELLARVPRLEATTLQADLSLEATGLAADTVAGGAVTADKELEVAAAATEASADDAVPRRLILEDRYVLLLSKDSCLSPLFQ